MILTARMLLNHRLKQWFPKWAIPPPGGGEAEMGACGAIGVSVNNYISVVLLTLSDQMS